MPRYGVGKCESHKPDLTTKAVLLLCACGDKPAENKQIRSGNLQFNTNVAATLSCGTLIGIYSLHMLVF